MGPEGIFSSAGKKMTVFVLGPVTHFGKLTQFRKNEIYRRTDGQQNESKKRNT